MDFDGFETIRHLHTGDFREYTIPEEMTLFCPYPYNSIMTNEAVHGMMDQKITVRVGNDVYNGRITQTINYPERSGYTVRMSEIQLRII